MKRATTEQKVNKMLASGMTELSTRPWAPPAVFAKKKDGLWRFYVDYWKLNLDTKQDSYLLPHIDDALDMQACTGSALWTWVEGTGLWTWCQRLEGRWNLPWGGVYSTSGSFLLGSATPLWSLSGCWSGCGWRPQGATASSIGMTCRSTTPALSVQWLTGMRSLPFTLLTFV